MTQTLEPFPQEPTDVRPRKRFRDKLLKGLLTSARFYATVAAILVQLFGEKFGIDQEMALAIVQTIAAWVAGESIRPADNPFTSRRFWAMVATIAASLITAAGLGIDEATIQQIVLAVAAWIIGDSWRETLHGNAKMRQRLALRMKETYEINV